MAQNPLQPAAPDLAALCKEAAVAVRRSPSAIGESSHPIVEREGALRDVMEWYRNLPAHRQAGITVHLPDRRTKPYSFGTVELQVLAHQIEPDDWRYQPPSPKRAAVSR